MFITSIDLDLAELALGQQKNRSLQTATYHTHPDKEPFWTFLAPQAISPSARSSLDRPEDNAILPSREEVEPPCVIPSKTDRTTTPQEIVIGELRSYKLMGDNWDGEGAKAPNPASLETAVSFMNGLSDSLPSPEPMLHATGSAGLFWDTEKIYADIEFPQEGFLTYYIEQKGRKGKHRGGMPYVSGKIPEVISNLLRS